MFIMCKEMKELRNMLNGYIEDICSGDYDIYILENMVSKIDTKVDKIKQRYFANQDPWKFDSATQRYVDNFDDRKEKQP